MRKRRRTGTKTRMRTKDEDEDEDEEEDEDEASGLECGRRAVGGASVWPSVCCHLFQRESLKCFQCFFFPVLSDAMRILPATFERAAVGPGIVRILRHRTDPSASYGSFGIVRFLWHRAVPSALCGSFGFMRFLRLHAVPSALWCNCVPPPLNRVVRDAAGGLLVRAALPRRVIGIKNTTKNIGADATFSPRWMRHREQI